MESVTECNNTDMITHNKMLDIERLKLKRDILDRKIKLFELHMSTRPEEIPSGTQTVGDTCANTYTKRSIVLQKVADWVKEHPPVSQEYPSHYYDRYKTYNKCELDSGEFSSVAVQTLGRGPGHVRGAYVW